MQHNTISFSHRNEPVLLSRESISEIGEAITDDVAREVIGLAEHLLEQSRALQTVAEKMKRRKWRA